MDYEKKYKEALERAKELQHDNCWVTNIFPELKESEDEKIRMALIHYFSHPENTSFEYWEAIPKSKAIVWLEKQGEQKSAWSKEDDSKIESICRLLKTRFDKDTCDEVGFTRDKMCDYLSSLKNKIQPQWKPSEEHIRYLQAVVNDAHNIGSESCCIALRDLLAQLKKL